MAESSVNLCEKVLLALRAGVTAEAASGSPSDGALQPSLAGKQVLPTGRQANDHGASRAPPAPHSSVRTGPKRISVSGRNHSYCSQDPNYCYVSSSLEAEPSMPVSPSPKTDRQSPTSSSISVTGHMNVACRRATSLDVLSCKQAKANLDDIKKDKAISYGSGVEALPAVETVPEAPLTPPALQVTPAHAESAGSPPPTKDDEGGPQSPVFPAPTEHSLQRRSAPIRPAMRKTKSMPCVLQRQQGKSVHFEDKYEHTRLFLEAETPSTVVNTPTHIGPDPASLVRTIIEHNIPPFSTCYHGKPVLLEMATLSAGGNELTGFIQVANYAYEKEIWIRYTMDNWKSQNDVPAWYKEAVLPKEGNFAGVDRFEFSIRLRREPATAGDGAGKKTNDIIQLDSDHLAFAIGYHVAGGEYWDNNEERNYKLRIERASTLANSPDIDAWAPDWPVGAGLTSAGRVRRSTRNPSLLDSGSTALSSSTPRRVTVGFAEPTKGDDDPDEIPIAIKRPDQRIHLYPRYDWFSLDAETSEESVSVSATMPLSRPPTSTPSSLGSSGSFSAASIVNPVPLRCGVSDAGRSGRNSPAAGPSVEPFSIQRTPEHPSAQHLLGSKADRNVPPQTHAISAISNALSLQSLPQPYALHKDWRWTDPITTPVSANTPTTANPTSLAYPFQGGGCSWAADRTLASPSTSPHDYLPAAFPWLGGDPYFGTGKFSPVLFG